jgi:hypothetical protein
MFLLAGPGAIFAGGGDGGFAGAPALPAGFAGRVAGFGAGFFTAAFAAGRASLFFVRAGAFFLLRAVAIVASLLL